VYFFIVRLSQGNMNKTIKVLGRVIEQAKLREIITVSCITSVLSLGSVAPSLAAILCFEVKGDKTSGSGKAYDGVWKFDVTFTSSPNKLNFKVVEGNTPGNTKTYKDVIYSYDATLGTDGLYSFKDSVLGTRTTPPFSNPYNVGMSGKYNLSNDSLMLDNLLTSEHKDPKVDPKIYKFNIKPCPIPEPTSTIGLLALGTLGAASTLKRQLKSSKSSEKETTKVS
jgi:hypothetical protein